MLNTASVPEIFQRYNWPVSPHVDPRPAHVTITGVSRAWNLSQTSRCPNWTRSSLGHPFNVAACWLKKCDIWWRILEFWQFILVWVVVLPPHTRYRPGVSAYSKLLCLTFVNCIENALSLLWLDWWEYSFLNLWVFARRSFDGQNGSFIAIRGQLCHRYDCNIMLIQDRVWGCK